MASCEVGDVGTASLRHRLNRECALVGMGSFTLADRGLLGGGWWSVWALEVVSPVWNTFREQSMFHIPFLIPLLSMVIWWCPPPCGLCGAYMS